MKGYVKPIIIAIVAGGGAAYAANETVTMNAIDAGGIGKAAIDASYRPALLQRKISTMLSGIASMADHWQTSERGPYEFKRFEPNGDGRNGSRRHTPDEDEPWSDRSAEAEAQKPLIQSSGASTSNFTPPDYLIDGLLQRRYLYSLTGRTGSGKTAIGLLMAAHIGLGNPIGKYEVDQGRVLYFGGENPDDIRMRWIAMSQQLDFDINNIPVHFIPGTFKISELIERINREIEALGGVHLIKVDTSAAFFEGDDDNDNVQQGEHARRLRSLVDLRGGCHPVKNASDDNLIPRGGGAFIAEVDGNLTATNSGSSIVELHWQGKFRGPDFAPIVFQLRTVTHERLKDKKGRSIPTVVANILSEVGEEELAAVARSEEDQLLEALSNNERASYAELAKHLGWALRDGQPNKMRRDRNRLENFVTSPVMADGGKNGNSEIQLLRNQRCYGMLRPTGNADGPGVTAVRTIEYSIVTAEPRRRLTSGCAERPEVIVQTTSRRRITVSGR